MESEKGVRKCITLQINIPLMMRIVDTQKIHIFTNLVCYYRQHHAHTNGNMVSENSELECWTDIFRAALVLSSTCSLSRCLTESFACNESGFRQNFLHRIISNILRFSDFVNVADDNNRYMQTILSMHEYEWEWRQLNHQAFKICKPIRRTVSSATGISGRCFSIDFILSDQYK